MSSDSLDLRVAYIVRLNGLFNGSIEYLPVKERESEE